MEQAESLTRTRSAGRPPQRVAAVTSSREKQAAALLHPPSRAHSDLNQGPANTGPRVLGGGNPRPRVDQSPLLQAAKLQQDPGGRGGARTPTSSPVAQETGLGLNWPGQPSCLPLSGALRNTRVFYQMKLQQAAWCKAWSPGAALGGERKRQAFASLHVDHITVLEGRTGPNIHQPTAGQSSSLQLHLSQGLSTTSPKVSSEPRKTHKTQRFPSNNEEMWQGVSAPLAFPHSKVRPGWK